MGAINLGVLIVKDEPSVAVLHLIPGLEYIFDFGHVKSEYIRIDENLKFNFNLSSDRVFWIFSLTLLNYITYLCISNCTF